MVTLSELEKRYSHLFTKSPVGALNELLDKNKVELPSYFYRIKEKQNLNLAEKKYLSWVRHSLAFLQKNTGPETILESWTSDVNRLLQSEWEKVFQGEANFVAAYMGKLGSGELNLSSDIDLIFFGKTNQKPHHLRDFIDLITAKNSVPSGFKLDLDLRPGGSSAALFSTANQLGQHLWNSSDPWERYSYSRMRIDLGDKELKEKIIKIRDQFCFRKYLSSDFFHSFLDLRKEYQKRVEGEAAHIKLGAGGIRDIELFAQTFQILYGGKNDLFKNKSTFELIDAFIYSGINKKTFEKFKAAYLVLRQAEGELHALKEQGGFLWEDHKSDWGKLVLETMTFVNDLIEDYAQSSINPFGTSKKSLSRKSFVKAVETYFENDFKKRERALKNFDFYFGEKNMRFKPYIRAILSQDKVKESFMDLLTYSNYGCQILSRRPSLLDVFLLRESEIDHSSEQGFLNNLSDVKMVQRILAANHFAKTNDLDKLGLDLSKSYEFILKEILPADHGIDLLFLGKMASRELGLQSDLDFILVYDEEKDVKKTGPGFSKQVYRKLSHLTIFGPLVPFDRDGWPSGMASPLVIPIEKLKKFLLEDALHWQKLMYLKQRWLYGNEPLRYLKTAISQDEIQDLFEILIERLTNYSVQKDELKLGPGGLFHTEFIIGALYLKKGIQPHGEDKIKELIEGLKTKENESILQNIKENYYKISRMREHTILLDRIKKNDPFDILEENCKLLEELSEKNFNIKTGALYA